MEDHNQKKMMACYERMLIATVPLGCRPAPALRLKLTASAFFEVAVAAAAEGNLDAAQKAMTSGRAALDAAAEAGAAESMGRMTEGVADPHTRNSWGWAARRRVDAAFARWEADAPVRAAALAAAAEEARVREAEREKRREQVVAALEAEVSKRAAASSPSAASTRGYTAYSSLSSIGPS
jgi:hypothetical protein